MQAVAHKLSNWLVLFYLIGASWMTAQVAPSSSASTVIKAGRLLDPRTGNVLSPAAVLIEGNKIKQVGSPSQIGAGSPYQRAICSRHVAGHRGIAEQARSDGRTAGSRRPGERDNDGSQSGSFRHRRRH